MRSSRESGYTLTELLITLGILSPALAASRGRIQSVAHQQRLVGAANQITTHLRLARERSVAEGNHYVVTLRPDTNDYQSGRNSGGSRGGIPTRRLGGPPRAAVACRPHPPSSLPGTAPPPERGPVDYPPRSVITS